MRIRLLQALMATALVASWARGRRRPVGDAPL